MGCMSSADETENQKEYILLQNGYFYKFLNQLRKQFAPTNGNKNLINHDVWEFVVKKFTKYSFSKNQKMELLDQIDKILQANIGVKQQTKQAEFCDKISSKLHQLESLLYFKHKHCLQYLKYVSSQACNQAFSEMKFDLSSEEIKEVAKNVRSFCNNNLDAFSFLTLYLQISLKNRANEVNFDSLSEMMVKQMKILQKLYPANNNQAQTKGNSPTLESFSPSQKYEVFTFSDTNKSHYDQLEQFIVLKAHKASLDQELFKSLVKQICYDKGYGFKYGLKIKPNIKNSASIFRVVQKLMDKDSFEEKFKKQKQSTQDSFRTASQPSNDLQKKVKEEIQSVEDAIKRILQKEKSIQFDSKDLIRAKCVFSKIDDVIETAKKLTHQINSKGCKVLQLKNRLGKNTKDVTLIIKLPNSVAQLQLALKLDSQANEFNHRIYEIIRSNMYSPITSLFIHNKKWGDTFFSQQITIFNEASILSASRDYQEQVKFNDLKKSVGSFKEKFLSGNISLLNQQGQQLEKNETLMKIKEIEKNMVCLGQAEVQIYRLNVEILKNDIQFCKNFYNSQLAMEKTDLMLKQEKQINPQSLFVADTYQQAGTAYRKKGEYSKALDSFRKCLEIRLQILGKWDLPTADCYNHMGIVYKAKGEYDEAISYLKKCLEIFLKVFGKQQHPDIAVCNSIIGQVYEDKRQFELAIEFYTKSLVIRQIVYGKQNIETACSYNDFAGVYKKQVDYQKAIQFYNKTLQIVIKAVGKQHPDTALVYNNIGIAYTQNGQFNRAIEYYNKSLQIYKKEFGQYDLNTAISYNSLGTVYCSKKQYEKALEFFISCLEIRQTILGDQHVSTGNTYNNIAGLYKSMEQYDKSLEYYKKSLSIQQNVFGRKHEYTIEGYLNQGLVYNKKGESKKALDNFETCLDISQDLYGKQSFMNCKIHKLIAESYMESGQNKKALEYFEKSLRIAKRIFDPSDNYIAQVTSSIAKLRSDSNVKP